MAGTKHKPRTALSFNIKPIVLSATVKNTLRRSGYMKPRSPSLLRGITQISQRVCGFRTPESKSIFLPFFPLRCSPAFYPEEYRDKSSFPYRVCKWIGEPGFKHSEQLSRMTRSYEMTYQIGWKRLQMLRSFRDKKKSKVPHQTENKALNWANWGWEPWSPLGPCSIPTLSLGDHCRIPTPPFALIHLLTQNVFSRQPCKLDCDILPITTLQWLSVSPWEEHRKLSPWAWTPADPALASCSFGMLCPASFTPPCHTNLQTDPTVSQARCCSRYHAADFSHISKSISLKCRHVPSGLCVTITVSETPSSTITTILLLLQFSTTAAFSLSLFFSFPTHPMKNDLFVGSLIYYLLPQLEYRLE